ncbi:hypothetical protein ACI3L3_06940 [Desulfobaculum sp. SPO524]
MNRILKDEILKPAEQNGCGIDDVVVSQGSRGKLRWLKGYRP